MRFAISLEKGIEQSVILVVQGRTRIFDRHGPRWLMGCESRLRDTIWLCRSHGRSSMSRETWCNTCRCTILLTMHWWCFWIEHLMKEWTEEFSGELLEHALLSRKERIFDESRQHSYFLDGRCDKHIVRIHSQHFFFHGSGWASLCGGVLTMVCSRLNLQDSNGKAPASTHDEVTASNKHQQQLCFWPRISWMIGKLIWFRFEPLTSNTEWYLGKRSTKAFSLGAIKQNKAFRKKLALVQQGFLSTSTRSKHGSNVAIKNHTADVQLLDVGTYWTSIPHDAKGSGTLSLR